MLKGRIVRKVMIVGVALCATGMTAITGCLPKPVYSGRWNENLDCVKYGDECVVFSVQFADGYTVAEYVVDLR